VVTFLKITRPLKHLISGTIYLMAKISKDELQKRILIAIGSGSNLVRSISNKTNLDGGIILDELEEMQGTSVEYIKTGTFTAWFLSGKSPKGKIVLDGKGGVIEISNES
jgi:hypothetical protein